MIHGELEARTLEAGRVQAGAPPDVSRQLRLTAQAEADAWQQSAEAATRNDQTQAANAKALASRIAAERQRLEAVNARYEQWSAATTSTREIAAKARAELERRRFAQHSAAMRQPHPRKRTTSDGRTTAAARSRCRRRRPHRPARARGHYRHERATAT